MSDRLSHLYESVVIKHPKLTVAVVLLAFAVLAAGLPRIKVDASADSLTLEHDTDLDYNREITERYQSGDFLVITYTPENELFSDASLNTLRSLRDDLLEIEGITGSLSILDVPLLYSPPLTLSEITSMEEFRTLTTPGVDREQAMEEYQESPLYRDTLVSKDGRTTAIQLNIAVNNKYLELVRERDALRLKQDQEGLSEQEQERLDAVAAEFRAYRTELAEQDRQRIEQVRQVVAKYQDEAEIFVGGVSMIAADTIAFVKSDLVTFGTAVIIFIIAMLAIIFRQPRFVILPFATCVLVVSMMLGYLGWVDWRITVISNNFVSLLLILTLALNIYIVVRYRELHARNPEWTQQQLVLEAARQMALPCLYTVLTTLVAFVSLVVSDIKPVIDFGWMMTIGLSLAYIMTFSFLPAALVLLPKGEPKEKVDTSRAFTEHFARFAEKRGGVVLTIAALAAVAAVVGISRLDVENRPIDYFHESTEIYQGLSVIDRQLGGTTPLDIILDAPQAGQGTATEDDPFAEPDDPFGTAGGGSAAEDPFGEGSEADDPFAEDDPFGDDPFADEADGSPAAKQSYWFTVAGLRQIEALHDYLESLPEVGRVQSLATAYKVARDINGGPLNDFELQVLQNQLPAEMDDLLASFLSFEANQTRINLRVQEIDSGLDRQALPEKIRRFAVDEVGLAPEQVHFTGLLVLYNNVLQSLYYSQIVTLGTVFLGIMIMFMILFRSIRLSVVAIVPNLIAAGVVLGSMGLFGISLDLMNIMVAAITVGMGVDNAIHYIYRFKQEFKVDGDYVAAMHRSHQSIGRAMYYTAITIIIGFSVLALSKFIPSIYFGLLTSLAIAAAILGSLTLLPKLILLVKPLGPGREA
ncbi:efflux RND transporter permease subunit [Gilvimarinus sp. F26214L]|uniref:efflux RND transporter permease subunit n=1 Tax=Gilvimarinus sp. DZF01 TaxID=3461371 RepID=UPI004045ABDD